MSEHEMEPVKTYKIEATGYEYTIDKDGYWILVNTDTIETKVVDTVDTRAELPSAEDTEIPENPKKIVAPAEEHAFHTIQKAYLKACDEYGEEPALEGLKTIANQRISESGSDE